MAFNMLIFLFGTFFLYGIDCGYPPGIIIEHKIIIPHNATTNSTNTTNAKPVYHNNSNYQRNNGFGNSNAGINYIPQQPFAPNLPLTGNAPPTIHQSYAGGVPYAPNQPITTGNAAPIIQNQQAPWNPALFNQGNVNTPGKRTTTVGNCGLSDTLLLRSVVIKKQKWYRSSIVEKELTFPDKVSPKRIREITCIRFEDNTKDGTGGHAKVLEGGPGKARVKILYESVPNKSIVVTTEIYGHEF